MKKIFFIYGILQRSGTNLLNQILLLNPNTIQPNLRIREDWFLHYSDSLYTYANHLFQVWSDPQWEGASHSKIEFYSTIGDALINYISKGIPDLSDKVILSKTPSVQHLKRNFEFFPSSKIIIITRDPRDVAASAFKSWKRPVRQTIKDWNVAAKAIAEFEKCTSPDYYLLLRYEDLISNREEVIRRCIRFLGFSEKDYPWHILNTLPVFGSSEEGNTWQVKAASPSFNSIGRWKTLPNDQINDLLNTKSPFSDYFGYSNGDEILSLPTRENRLNSRVLLSDNISSPLLIKDICLERMSKIYMASGLIAEAALGTTVTNYLRAKLRKKK